MIQAFEKKQLSKGGFKILVSDKDVRLPNGEYVESGLQFRNSFHLNPLAASDVFVPCGGRPESVNLGNVNTLIDEETKKPRFQVIVEGANLFFTQEARLFLEKRGVIIFKDASANKGGVTSSSLEVLAALSLTDEEFEQHMTVKGEKVPTFYGDYVKEVHRIIEENARLEFQCIWNEHEKSGTPRSPLSDVISNKINELSKSIAESDLWTTNPDLRRRVLYEACPRNLLELLGLEIILKRVPETYARAIFGCYLASRYVYQFGLSANPEFAFFKFLSGYLKN